MARQGTDDDAHSTLQIETGVGNGVCCVWVGDQAARLLLDLGALP